LELFPELDVVDRVKIKTRYGRPSDVITIAQRNGQTVRVFWPRHGSKHHLPPHRIPYRANIAAFKKLGIKTVIGTCIVGSLKRKLVPDRSLSRAICKYDMGRDDVGTSSNFIHLPMAEPYCACLRRELSKVALSEKVVACRAEQ